MTGIVAVRNRLRRTARRMGAVVLTARRGVGVGTGGRMLSSMMRTMVRAEELPAHDERNDSASRNTPARRAAGVRRRVSNGDSFMGLGR